MVKSIAIDAAFGGFETGYSSHNRLEKNDNLRLAKEIESQLIQQKQKVLMIRTDDRFVNLENRVAIANDENVDYYLSITRNSYVSNIANGVEIWVSPHASKQTANYAETILNRITNVGVQQNRGVQKCEHFLLNKTTMPASILKLGFITNTIDNSLFDRYFKKYAQAIVQGICENLYIDYNTHAPIEKKDKKNTYRVVMGTFMDRIYAEDLARELNANGYAAVVVKD